MSGEVPKSNPPRLLIEPSDAALYNIGDMAMMYSATRRLHEVLPGATLEVLSASREELNRVCPDVQPLGDDLRLAWLKLLPRPIARALPIALSTALRPMVAKYVLPVFCIFSARARSGRRKARLFLDSVRDASAMIVTGMGSITDTFGGDSYRMLETIALVLSQGKPVMMVGQGIGPITSRWLRARAAFVLSRVEVIGVREARATVPLLRQLGVPAERIAVTGDDALELGYEMRSEVVGNAIGLNVRMAYYSGVSPREGRRIAEVVRQQASARGAQIVPLSIAGLDSDSDIKSLRTILPESAGELARLAQLRTPIDMIPEVRRCRIVVAGSYHAAVFALSAGIPAIGIANVPYYVSKFAGLQDLFGEGCAWVDLGEAGWEENLDRQIARLWDEADRLRGHLLGAADRQITAGRELYARIAERIRSLEHA